jgi:hypothetical protein
LLKNGLLRKQKEEKEDQKKEVINNGLGRPRAAEETEKALQIIQTRF